MISSTRLRDYGASFSQAKKTFRTKTYLAQKAWVLLHHLDRKRLQKAVLNEQVRSTWSWRTVLGRHSP